MKYFKSLLKYIAGIVIAVALMVSIQLCLPQGHVELTANQAVLMCVGSILFMAVALKFSVDNTY